MPSVTLIGIVLHLNRNMSAYLAIDASSFINRFVTQRYVRILRSKRLTLSKMSPTILNDVFPKSESILALSNYFYEVIFLLKDVHNLPHGYKTLKC